MTAPELMPCPFCGETPKRANATGSYVFCHNCRAEGPFMEVDAIAAWNTRAEKAKARLLELEKAARKVVNQDAKPEYNGRYSELSAHIGKLRDVLGAEIAE